MVSSPSCSYQRLVDIHISNLFRRDHRKANRSRGNLRQPPKAPPFSMKRAWHGQPMP